jgi:hypothetical protein
MIAASSKIPEREYHGIAWNGGLYATAIATAATAHGKTICVKAALRSVDILPQCSHRYSTVTLGDSLDRIVWDVAL